MSRIAQEPRGPGSYESGMVQVSCFPKFYSEKGGKCEVYLPFGESPFVPAPAQLTAVRQTAVSELQFSHFTSIRSLSHSFPSPNAILQGPENEELSILSPHLIRTSSSHMPEAFSQSQSHHPKLLFSSWRISMVVISMTRCPEALVPTTLFSTAKFLQL